VALDDEAELKKAFSPLREAHGFFNKIWVKRTYDLRKCIGRVFQGDLTLSEKTGLQPWQDKSEPVIPTKAEQTAFYICSLDTVRL
jgi:hypothetical protein